MPFCASRKVKPSFFKFVVCNHNPCESSPSLTILVSLWFINVSLVFSIIANYYFQVSFNLKAILYLAKIIQNTTTEVF